MNYSIRPAEPKDVWQISELHRLQNLRDGTNYPMPEIFDGYGRLMPNIALAFVIENKELPEGTTIRQGVIFERMAEMLLFGCDPKATAQLHREIDGCFYLLRRKGYETAHCFVPKQVVIPIEKPLEKVGFKRDEFRLAHFCKDLTKVRDEEEESQP